MKTVTKYVAEDGKEFLTDEECINYELALLFVKRMREDYSSTYNIESALLAIVTFKKVCKEYNNSRFITTSTLPP